MTVGAPRAAIDRRLLVTDAVTIAAAAAGLLLLLVGPVRRGMAGTFVVIGWEHAWFLAAALVAVRHAWRTSPSILVSLQYWQGAIVARPSLADALLAFWLTRPAVLVVGFVAVVTIGLSPHATQTTGDPLDSLANRFDAGWYAGIAAEGYDWQHRFDRQQNIAFFPAYPMLVRAAGFVTGAFQPGIPYDKRIARLAWTGTVIAAVAFFWACWYFSRLAREFLDPPRASAALLLLAAYPFSVFYSAAYTESLFLLAALGAWYHFRHRQWVAAAIWGVLAGLTRPNGFFLSLPLGLIALGVRDACREPHSAVSESAPLWIRLTVASAPVVGMLLYTTFLFSMTRVWFAWARMHGAWGRVLGSTPALPDHVWSGGDGVIRAAIAHPYETMNTAGLLFAISLTYAVFRRVGPPWAIFVLATILPPLAAGGVLSMGRLTSTLFPLFLALASLLSSRAALGCAAAFGVLQGLAAALFFTWRELY
jgi:Mannosyltransferase (PIG-V)